MMQNQRQAAQQNQTNKVETTYAEEQTFGTFEQQAKNLPALQDAKGQPIELSIANIQELGREAGDMIGSLSDSILAKVRIADSGELGEGINNILTLTRKIDIEKLGETNTGFIGRVWNIFGDTKQKVMDQFETSADQIEKISDTLVTGISRMRGETVWLEETYRANIEYLHELERILENVESVLDVENAALVRLQADQNTPLEILQEKDLMVEALDKQADKLRRLAQIARLTAPQIQSMRKVNSNTIEKFNSLHQTIIPLWKQSMSSYLISLQQSKDTELACAMDNETNRLMTSNSKNVADNMKNSAKANQRSVIDIKTLQEVQNNMLEGIRDTMKIEQDGRNDRAQAKIQLETMNENLKAALRNVVDNSNDRLRGRK